MILMHMTFSTEALMGPTDVNILLPQGEGLPEKLPVVWLLHGMFGCYADWSRLTSVERYASDRGLALVMPSADNSFYCDMAHGERYFTYVTEELPRLVRSILPISDRREDNYIAGLSMGGYGAMKIALTYPERFAAVASLSGVLDTPKFVSDNAATMPDLSFRIFGGADPTGTDADTMALLRRRAAEGASLPDLYAWCGTEDFLIESNRAFRTLAGELNVPLHYKEQPGIHDWAFWDDTILQFLQAVRPL